jgi:hypothetical protein
MSDMKKGFAVSILVPLLMICSCQKQDSAAEQEVGQRKAELDAREKALDEKVNALDEKVNVLEGKVKALAEKERATLNAPTTPTDVQGQTPDAAQAQSEKERIIQQFSAQMRSLNLDHSKMKAEKDREMQERRAQKQSGLEGLQGQKRKSQMYGAPAFPSAESALPAQSPAVESTSPIQSPTPQ